MVGSLVMGEGFRNAMGREWGVPEKSRVHDKKLDARDCRHVI
jgi:hypothetical protein